MTCHSRSNNRVVTNRCRAFRLRCWRVIGDGFLVRDGTLSASVGHPSCWRGKPAPFTGFDTTTVIQVAFVLVLSIVILAAVGLRANGICAAA